MQVMFNSTLKQVQYLLCEFWLFGDESMNESFNTWSPVPRITDTTCSESVILSIRLAPSFLSRRELFTVSSDAAIDNNIIII